MEKENKSEINQTDKEYIDRIISNLKSPETNPKGKLKYPNNTVGQLVSTISFGETPESIYAVESLLEIINDTPLDPTEDDEKKAFGRTIAIAALIETFDFKNTYTDKPQLIEEIVNTITERRLKFDKDISFPDFPIPTNFYYREREIIETFFDRATELIRDSKIQEKIFSCLVDGTGIKDDSLAVKEHELIIHMLKKAATEREDLDLFEKYINILSEREDCFDPTDEYDYHAQYNMIDIYSTIFSLYPELPIKTRKKVNNDLLKKIINTVKNHPDDGIRHRYISPLDKFIEKKGTTDPDYLDEQLELEIEIQKTLVNIIENQVSEIHEKEVPYYTSIFSAYMTLLKILNVYTEGVRANPINFYQVAQKKYGQEYKKAFNTVTNNIPKNERVKAHILNSLNKFINLEVLNDPNHPLLNESKSFLLKYYGPQENRIEPALKKAKEL
jgi:hypothetical protein